MNDEDWARLVERGEIRREVKPISDWDAVLSALGVIGWMLALVAILVLLHFN